MNTRRQTQASVAVESAEPKRQLPKKQFVVKQKENKDTSLVFRTIQGSGVAFIIKQKGVTVYDKQNDTIRSIRYCPNEPSIFVDEQSEHAVREAVIFRDGFLMVPAEKPNLKAYLMAHPGNKKNGGSIFEVVDNESKAENTLEMEFSISKAIDIIRDTELSDLLPIAIYFGINIDRKTSEIKFDLVQTAKKNPAAFMDAMDSPTVRIRSILYQAKEFQILNFKEDAVKWYDSNQVIVSVPVGQDPMDVMARFCMTDKGSLVLEDLENRLSKL
jgi:hypothetical protein